MPEPARILSPEEALEEGERALIRAASEGMTEKDMLAVRETLIERGVPTETLNKLFPDLPNL